MEQKEKIMLGEVPINEVLYKGNEDTEVIEAQSTEKELKEREKRIRENAERIQEVLNGLSAEEKKDYIKQMANDLAGGDIELGQGDPEFPYNEFMQFMEGKTDWDASKIITSLGVWFVRQTVETSDIAYKFNDLVPLRIVENGAWYRTYKDYTDADEVSGYSDVVISDYNQGINKLTYETWEVYKEIHKGYDLISTMLNDVAKNTALFIAMVHDLQFNLSRPIIKRIYQYRLQLIADPFTDLNKDGIDITSKNPDITYEADNLKEALMQFVIHYETLNYPSRTHTPNSKWIPNKFTQDIEIQPRMEEISAIFPVEMFVDWKWNFRAEAYQLGELEIKNIVPINYKLTFEEYGKIKGINHGKNAEGNYVYDCFIVQNGAVELMQHYNGIKVVDTPKLKSVVNQYTRLGQTVDKTKRIWFIRFIIKAKPASDKVDNNSQSDTKSKTESKKITTKNSKPRITVQKEKAEDKPDTTVDNVSRETLQPTNTEVAKDTPK